MVPNRQYLPLALSLLAFAGLGMAGCANPGQPKPPSLKLPVLVKDLTATRRGNIVELRFTLPHRSTDDLPLRAATIKAEFCRALDAGPCVAAAGLPEQSFARVANGQTEQPNLVVVHDTLPAAWASGSTHVLTYRVELLSDAGRTAGLSDAAYTVAGAAPSPVEDFHAEGSRLGVVLRWKPATPDSANSGVVVLRRQDLAPKPMASRKSTQAAPLTARQGTGTQAGSHHGRKPAKVRAAEGSEDEDPTVEWLTTAPQPDPLAQNSPADVHPAGNVVPGSDAGITLDATALAEEPYRYTAERRRTVQIGGRALELRSEASAPLEFTLRDVYPPPEPAELSAASFTGPRLAVDLIWQPVDDPRLAGYNVYREGLNRADSVVVGKARLNQAPVPLPAFHDATVNQGERYRYSVTAVDARGNESAAAVTTLDIDSPF